MTRPSGVLLGLCLALFSSITASAGQSPSAQPAGVTPAAGLSQGLDPGTTVPFELTRGRFLKPLPFDVQFYVQSPVEERVTTVSGRYATLCRDALDPASRNATSLGRAVFLPATGTPPVRAVELSVPPRWLYVADDTVGPPVTEVANVTPLNTPPVGLPVASFAA